MLPHDQPTVCLVRLLEIHLNGTWIGMLDGDQKRIQLLVWNGWVVEIECRYKQQHWIPVGINYHLQTPRYQALLDQQLSPDQLQRLRYAMQAYCLN